MQHLEVSGAVRPLKSSLGAKRLRKATWLHCACKLAKIRNRYFLNASSKLTQENATKCSLMAKKNSEQCGTKLCKV